MTRNITCTSGISVLPPCSPESLIFLYNPEFNPKFLQFDSHVNSTESCSDYTHSEIWGWKLQGRNYNFYKVQDKYSSLDAVRIRLLMKIRWAQKILIFLSFFLSPFIHFSCQWEKVGEPKRIGPSLWGFSIHSGCCFYYLSCILQIWHTTASYMPRRLVCICPK